MHLDQLPENSLCLHSEVWFLLEHAADALTLRGQTAEKPYPQQQHCVTRFSVFPVPLSSLTLTSPGFYFPDEVALGSVRRMGTEKTTETSHTRVVAVLSTQLFRQRRVVDAWPCSLSSRTRLHWLDDPLYIAATSGSCKFPEGLGVRKGCLIILKS